ncbi:MAG: response regulator transcription factor [Paracoccaceae bacterium]|nr:response regulator transcription factor [Paracoccaceae bacterium]MDE3122512.1 response regulator transcription factor [Paracoccaceae bacterium]MDE3238068.1 response regulator transcription factor [Paracoccaceae bacterium]
MRILIGEDEEALCTQMRTALETEGHAVDVTHRGEETLFMGQSEPYDLVILDLGLPEIDGLTILKRWRRDGVDVPVLIVTARSGWSERIDGLDAGADDYVTKPFHMPELLARVRALLRRRFGQTTPVFERGGLRYEVRSGLATRDGLAVDLTQLESAVMTYLVMNMGRFVSRSEISDHIYAYDGDRDSNTIAVFINRLRAKLGSDLIRTVRGRGYMIEK